MNRTASVFPLRDSQAGKQIDTRPLQVEEWLDSLPYADFHKTAWMLMEATKLTNQQTLKPSVRQELTRLYHRPYQYYLHTLLQSGTQHTRQSIEAVQGQIYPLKQIAVNLGHACKIALAEELERKTLWGQSRMPLLLLLMELHYISEAMLFGFLEYAPTPKGAWKEINFIYRLAERLGNVNTPAIPFGSNKKEDATTIADGFKRIALASLVDPHHLPFGAVWEIYSQLCDWAPTTEITPYQQFSGRPGLFIIDLDSDIRPTPSASAESDKPHEHLRMFETTALGVLIRDQMRSLQAGAPSTSSMRLSPHHAKSILLDMSRAYGLPSKRYFPRSERSGRFKLVFGLDAIHYHLNDKRDFVVPGSGTTESILVESEESVPANREGNTFACEEWELVNEGIGGYSVTRDAKNGNTVHVGGLLGVSRNSDIPTWELGMVRWVVIRPNRILKIGIQKIASQLQPAAIRAIGGTHIERSYRRALIKGNPDESPEYSVVAEKGLFLDNRELELCIDGHLFIVYSVTLIAELIGYEYFSIKSPAATLPCYQMNAPSRAVPEPRDA